MVGCTQRCEAQGQPVKRAQHPNPVKHRQRLRQYSLTPEQFEALLRSHHGQCAICNAGVATCIDHDHKTGKVRGLLCAGCNSGLGQFRDNPEVLEQAARYLRCPIKL